MNNTAQWFQQRLSPRLDALQVVLQALAAGEPDAESTARRLAMSLREPAQAYGFEDIAKAAAEVESCAPSTLETHVQHLIRALREESVQAHRVAATLLTIAIDPAMGARLRDGLTAPDRQVALVETAADAQHVLREREVVLIVLNIVLPDMDGRVFLSRLRDNPLTASIPVLVLAPVLSESIREDDLALEADGIMEQPIDEDDAMAWIKSRLRRAHEKIREARRDQLTGLLNRAAFRETLGEMIRTCATSQVPVALASVSIDGYREIADEHGPRSGDEILRRVGLLLSASLRITDVIGRWDVAEFTVIFPAEDQFGGSRAIEKVIERAREMRIELADGFAVSVTLSGGVSVAGGDVSTEDLLTEAQRYLFRATSEGGDRVVSNRTAAPEHSKHVLLLISEELTARVVAGLLDKEGFASSIVADPEQAVAAASDSSLHHLIVLDERMGDSGFGVLEALRAQTRLNRVPILMLLSKNTEEGMVRALELGANDYLARPFSPFAFLNHVRRLLARGGSADMSEGKTPRILVVSESTRDLLMAATALRERGGFHAFLGRGGADGLERLREKSPDILVFDFEMKDMPGPRFLEEVKQAADIEEMSVVIAASAAGDERWQGYLAEGVKGVIGTPFDPLTLAEKIEQALGMEADTKRTLDSADHLNEEILRVMRLGEE